MTRFQNRLIFLIVVLISLNCASLDPTAPGPQPHYIENVTFQPQLNVFGVLRPDSVGLLPLSFVHVERSYPPDERPDSATIADARVVVFRMEGTTVADSAIFIYTDFGTFTSREYRNASFFPQPGTYRLVCQKQGYPELSAETTLPAKPVIQQGSLKLEANSLSFQIKRDEQVGLYRVIFRCSQGVVGGNFLRPQSGDVKISLSLTGIDTNNGQLIIYGYDLNLSRYLTANLSIKPNIFQQDFSTVTNGYGCFGSLNVMQTTIQF